MAFVKKDGKVYMKNEKYKNINLRLYNVKTAKNYTP